MSYQEGGNLSPHVSTITPTTATGGNATFTIDGASFSPSMKVDIPTGLGSLVSISVTQPTATTSRAVIVINANAPPTTATPYTIKLSNGGESGSNSETTITHLDWTPAELCTGSTDYWWNPDSLNATLNDFSIVSSFPSTAGGLTLTESNSTYQPVFRKNYEWTTGKFASGIGQGDNSSNYKSTVYFDDVAIPLANAASGNMENVTFAFVAKNLNTTLSSNQTYPVSSCVSKARIGYRQNMGWYTASSGYSANFDFNIAGAVARAMLTQDNGTEVLKVHPFGVNITNTYTPSPASTTAANRQLFRSLLGGPVMYGEVVLINRTLTASEISKLETYWNDKYGV